MRLGLDIDNTISAYPKYYADLSRKVKERGGRVIIISSRSETPDVREITSNELNDWNIKFDKLYLFKSLDDVKHLCPYKNLGDYNTLLWQKLHHCIAESIEQYHDDDSVVIRLFKSYLPSVEVIDSKNIIDS